METVIYNGEVAYKTKYDGYYVTRSGKAISVKVKGGQGKKDYDNPREMSYKVDKDGYLELCISLIENGKHKRKYVRTHRLVYETIVGEIPDELTIDHKDTNKKNNNIDNLQTMTRVDNSRKAKLNVKSPKRYMYRLFKDNERIGTYDRKELERLIGLKYSDFYNESANKKQLLLQGYKWILESVEDIERVS